MKLKLLGIGLSILGGIIGLADTIVKDKALDQKVTKTKLIEQSMK